MTESNFEFVGMAKVIESLSELPKIGDKFGDFAILDSFKNAYCISINAYEYENIKESVKADLTEEDGEKYLFFEVYYCEDKGKNMWLGLNTFHFLYCILKENIR